MYFVTLDDFYEKAAAVPPRCRESELLWAKEMKDGSADAREKLIQSYLPMAASAIRHSPANLQSLSFVYECVTELGRQVDHFNFFQEGETFTHRLSWALRQALVRHIANTP